MLLRAAYYITVKGPLLLDRGPIVSYCSKTGKLMQTNTIFLDLVTVLTAQFGYILQIPSVK